MRLALEIALILLLISANGLLAMAEIAIVSARRVRLQQRANEGDEKARAALALAEDPADFLSTVQIGITLVGILAGAFGGATLAQSLAAFFASIPWLAPYSQALGLGLVVLLITYLSLILGELVPKRLALGNPEGVASAVAGPMKTLSRLTAPVVSLLSFSTTLVLRLFGVRPTDEPPITEEEIKVLIQQGAQAGVFEPAEQDMVEGVFRLGDRRIGRLMTPRTEITWLDLEMSPAELRHQIVGSTHSRFPVGRGSLDEIEGIVQAKDLLARTLDGKSLDIKAHTQPAVFVPESTPSLKVLELFRESQQQMLLVIDEFGGMQGLVTIMDIIEAIVGDLPSLGEAFEPEAVQREDGSWLLGGMLPVDKIASLLEVKGLPDQNSGYYQTLGGFMMTQLGRIPVSGDHFEWGGLRFEVVDMDEMRVDKVLVIPVDPAPEE